MITTTIIIIIIILIVTVTLTLTVTTTTIIISIKKAKKNVSRRLENVCPWNPICARKPMQMDWNYPEIIALHSEATTLIFGFRGDPFDFLANRPNVKKKQISCMQLLESLLNIATQCLACLPLTILRFHWAHIWKDHTANQTIGNLAVPGVPFVYVGWVHAGA